MGSLGTKNRYVFYDIKTFNNEIYLNRRERKSLLKFNIYPDIYEIVHSRKEYDVIDLLGDIGGIQNILVILFGWFFYSLSEYSMFMDAFNRIFVLDEKDRLDLFLQQANIYEDEKVTGPRSKFAKIKKVQVTETRFTIRHRIELFLLNQTFLFKSCINNGR